jgi:hypothetical protein
MHDETLMERVRRIEQFLGNELGASLDGDFSNRIAAGQRRVDEDMVLEKHLERAGNSTTEAVTSFEEIVNRIQGGTDRVRMIASNLEVIGNRVLGALPEDPGNLEKSLSPDGTLDHTFRALNVLDQALCRLHTAAARLDRI